MTQWYLAKIPSEAINLPQPNTIPIGLDPKWLSSRINSPDKYVQFYLQGDQGQPCGYAPFLVHTNTLDFYFGDITLFSIGVQKYTIQGAPICKDYFSLAELFKQLRKKINTNNVVFESAH